MFADRGCTRKPCTSACAGIWASVIAPGTTVVGAVKIGRGAVRSCLKPYPTATATKGPSEPMLMTSSATVPGLPVISKRAAWSNGMISGRAPPVAEELVLR